MQYLKVSLIFSNPDLNFVFSDSIFPDFSLPRESATILTQNPPECFRTDIEPYKLTVGRLRLLVHMRLTQNADQLSVRSLPILLKRKPILLKGRGPPVTEFVSSHVVQSVVGWHVVAAVCKGFAVVRPKARIYNYVHQ